VHPGEKLQCSSCHEGRGRMPLPATVTLARMRPPSPLQRELLGVAGAQKEIPMRSAVPRLRHAIFFLWLPFTAILPAAEEVRLSSLDLGLAQQGWGKPGIDRSVEGKRLRIAGRDYAHGYGTHAPGEVHLDLDGKVARFTACIGIDDEGGAMGRDGSVEFIVEADGTALWRSPILRGGMGAQRVDVALTGKRHVVLRVTDGGDGNARDHADWADSVFQVAGNRPLVVAPPPPPPRWILGQDMTTVWPVTTDLHLPHGDFIEQGGLRCGQVVEYHIDRDRLLSMKRGVVWPCLRIIPNDTTGSLTRHYGSEAEPAVSVDGAPLGPVVVERVLLDGTLTILGRAGADLAVTRCTFPSPERRCAIDRWTLRNTGTMSRTVTVAPLALRQDMPGPYGTNHSEVTCNAPTSTALAPGQELSFAVLFRAWLDGEGADAVDAAADEAGRRGHVAALQRDLRLETPVPEFDRAFAFCVLPRPSTPPVAAGCSRRAGSRTTQRCGATTTWNTPGPSFLSSAMPTGIRRPSTPTASTGPS